MFGCIISCNVLFYHLQFSPVHYCSFYHFLKCQFISARQLYTCRMRGRYWMLRLERYGNGRGIFWTVSWRGRK